MHMEDTATRGGGQPATGDTHKADWRWALGAWELTVRHRRGTRDQGGPHRQLIVAA
jgi:hypothetical protein